SRTAVQVHNRRDGALADTTERHLVAAEHQAIGLGPEIAAGPVVRRLERADVPVVRSSAEQTRVMHHLLTEERIHLRLGVVLGANPPPAFLDALRLTLELGLWPWCRHGRSRHHQVLPL